MITPKFDDCRTCVFFLKNRRNPICGECDAGEFYEEKRSSRERTNEELMKMYEDYHNDDE